MRLPKHQRGLGWFGLLLVLGTIGITAIVVVKCLPLYLNQMKLAKAVHQIADDPDLANSDPAALRNRMQRHWDIDDIILIEPKDIKVKRTDQGRFLSYDYEARTNLFYNIYLVIHFQDDVQMRNVNG